MKRLSTLILMIGLLIALVPLAPALASQANVTYYTTNGITYSLTTGVLGGADYALYMPEDWNGRLIVGCSGYNFFEDPHPELSFDSPAKGDLVKKILSDGYAFASSNYNGGERAWLTMEGIIRTHQLTEYLIDQYHITDKIFLMGHSMGGGISLMLAENPEVYSGVLDICGNKGARCQWDYGQIFLMHTAPEIRAILNWPSTIPDTQIAGLQVFFNVILTDKIEAAHGTPDERPQAYAKENTLLHADIQIPVISVVGAKDVIVPMQAHLEYQAAVAAEGQSSLYRMYVVTTCGHSDILTVNDVPQRLAELIAWSDSLD